MCAGASRTKLYATRTPPAMTASGAAVEFLCAAVDLAARAVHSTPVRERRMPIAGLRRIVVLAATVASLDTPRAAVAQSPTARVAAAADSIAALFRAESIPGLAIAVYHAGEPVLLRAYGYADVDRERRLRPSDPIEVASVTKQLVAVGILRLVDEGRLALDDSAARYVPQLTRRYPGVTVRQLLSHTSGVGYVDDELVGNPPRDDDGAIEVIAAAAPDTTAGARFAYNNSNFRLLGAVIDRVTGQRWDEYLARAFFKPLGMKHTRLCRARDPDRAVGYVMFGGYRRTGTALPLSATGAAAGMCSSAEDLGRWTAALHGGRLLSAASYREMMTPSSGKPSGYGFGTVVGSFAGRRTFYHPGGTSSGARSLVAYFPDDALAIVLLVNAQPVDLDRVEAAITDAWYDAASPAAPL